MELRTSNKPGCLKTQIGFSIVGRQIKKNGFDVIYKTKSFADEKWTFFVYSDHGNDEFFISKTPFFNEKLSLTEIMEF